MRKVNLKFNEKRKRKSLIQGHSLEVSSPCLAFGEKDEPVRGGKSE